MKSYNYNDIFASAKLGYAVLPSLGYYNPEDKTQSCIEFSEEEVISYFSKGSVRYINYIGDASIKPFFNTIKKQIFEKYKKEMWNYFDEYQKNNTPRYLEKINSAKKKILTEEEFYDSIYREYKKIEEGTLGELFRVERKMKALKKICEEQNLDYPAYYQRMVAEGKRT